MSEIKVQKFEPVKAVLAPVVDPGVQYEVTGVTTDGRRFKKVYKDLFWAMGINLWRGTVWERDLSTGKRRVLKQVYNG